MSRIDIDYPWVFMSQSGIVTAQELDDNFDAVKQAVIAIGTRVLAASYQLIDDDDYSFFLCVPTNNMTLSPPSSVAPNFSFWVSNQHTSTSVQLMGSWTIDGEEVLNPTIPGDYGDLVGVKGGLAVNDGSTWSLYPSLFLP